MYTTYAYFLLGDIQEDLNYHYLINLGSCDISRDILL